MHHRLAASICLASLMMFAPTRVSGQSAATDPHAAQPERPTVATHAYTVAPGYLEVEVGAQDMQPRSI
jgi:hypothetical protein